LNPSFLDFTLYPVPDEDWPAERVQGDGKNDILLLYQIEKEDDAAELAAFLDRILSAVKMDRKQEAYTIELTAGEAISLPRQPWLKSSSYVLIFGVQTHQLGLGFQLPAYQPIVFQGKTYLWSDALAAIAEERRQGGKKMSGQLWQALKTLFIH